MIYPSGKVSNIVEPVVQESAKRKVIGKYSLPSITEARKLVMEKIRELTAAPTHPSNYSSATLSIPPLSEAHNTYVSQIQLKPSTIATYCVVFRYYQTELHNTPLDQITEEMVINQYLEKVMKS